MGPNGRSNNFVIQMVGANHTGKSVTSRKIITEWRSSRGDIIYNPDTKRHERKYKVVAFDPKLQFDGIVDEFIRPEKNWAIPLCKLRNALIVLDDYKTLLPNYLPTPGMFELFAGRWHYNIDFIISCHSPGHVIEMLIDYITQWYIYHTKAGEKKFGEKMPDAKMLSDIATVVNKYVAIYGMGKHPNDPEFRGQKFPYIVYDTTKAEARPKGYNIRKDFTF